MKPGTRVLLDGRPGTVVANEIDDGMPVVDIDLDDGTKRWILWTPGNAKRVEIIKPTKEGQACH